MPTVVLGQDEVDCFASWVSIEAGLPEYADPSTDMKVSLNYSIYTFNYLDFNMLMYYLD